MSQRNEGMDLDFAAQFHIGIFSKLTNNIMVIGNAEVDNKTINIKYRKIINLQYGVRVTRIHI